MNEPEETGSMEPLHTTTHEIIFDNVDFSYVPGEPVLKHATFTVPDQKTHSYCRRLWFWQIHHFEPDCKNITKQRAGRFLLEVSPLTM